MPLEPDAILCSALARSPGVAPFVNRANICAKRCAGVVFPAIGPPYWSELSPGQAAGSQRTISDISGQIASGRSKSAREIIDLAGWHRSTANATVPEQGSSRAQIRRERQNGFTARQNSRARAGEG